jgi:2-dehydropantoate 2-reductase
LASVGTSIALIGPGAIGATAAAYLHTAGHGVLLCGHTPRESIEVRPDDHDPIVLPGPVRTDPAEVDGPVDVVFLAVKDTQNEQAGAWLVRLCDENTVVCALQNGVEQVDRVGRFCPSSTCGSHRKCSCSPPQATDPARHRQHCRSCDHPRAAIRGAR